MTKDKEIDKFVDGLENLVDVAMLSPQVIEQALDELTYDEAKDYVVPLLMIFYALTAAMPPEILDMMVQSVVPPHKHEEIRNLCDGPKAVAATERMLKRLGELQAQELKQRSRDIERN